MTSPSYLIHASRRRLDGLQPLALFPSFLLSDVKHPPSGDPAPLSARVVTIHLHCVTPRAATTGRTATTRITTTTTRTTRTMRMRASTTRTTTTTTTTTRRVTRRRRRRQRARAAARARAGAALRDLPGQARPQTGRSPPSASSSKRGTICLSCRLKFTGSPTGDDRCPRSLVRVGSVRERPFPLLLGGKERKC